MLTVLDRVHPSHEACPTVPAWSHRKAQRCIVCQTPARHQMPYEGQRRHLQRSPKMPALCCYHAAAYRRVQAEAAA